MSNAAPHTPLPPPTNPTFDIHQVYKSNLTASSPLPPALAAVSALTSALTTHNLTTVAEALSLLSTLNNKLRQSLANPIPACAGTDAFLQYLVNTIARPGAEGDSDFEATIQGVLNASAAFVETGLQARDKIAAYGRKVIRDGTTVVVPVVDEVVEGVLLDAAEAEVEFRVVFAGVDSAGSASAANALRVKRQQQLLSSLRERGILTAVVPVSGLAHALVAVSSARVNGFKSNGDVLVLAGASALLSNGGVMAPLGTLQACTLAKARGARVFVASEMWKAARWFPLEGEEKSYGGQLRWSYGKDEATGLSVLEDEQGEAVDVTPPEMITAIITEDGVTSPTALSEEAIKMWF